MKKILLAIILIAVVALGSKYMYSKNNNMAQASAVKGAVTEADIPAVREIALKLADKNILDNKEEFKKILSKKTIEYMEQVGWQTDNTNVLTYIDAKPEGNFMIANMKDAKGVQTQIPFIKENGAWKVAIMDALELDFGNMEKAQSAESVNTTNKKADLIITKIETSKSPNILNPNTEIKVTVKNIGKFTASPAQVDVDIYDTKNGRHGISSLTPILKPGGSTVVSVHPFADVSGKLLPENVVVLLAGSRKVVAQVNAFKRIPESNYANNSLTKKIVFTKKVVTY